MITMTKIIFSASHEQQKMMFRHTSLKYVFGTPSRNVCKPRNKGMTTTIVKQSK